MQYRYSRNPNAAIRRNCQFIFASIIIMQYFSNGIDWRSGNAESSADSVRWRRKSRLRHPHLSPIANERSAQPYFSSAMAHQGPLSILAHIRFQPFVIVHHLKQPTMRLPLPTPKTLLRVQLSMPILCSWGANDCHRMEEHPMSDLERIIRLKTVLARTGLSRSTMYRKIAEGTFPCQLKISVHGAGWRESAVNRWIANPIAYREEPQEQSCA
jgi:prophage regulatory protein